MRNLSIPVIPSGGMPSSTLKMFPTPSKCRARDHHMVHAHPRGPFDPGALRRLELSVLGPNVLAIRRGELKVALQRGAVQIGLSAETEFLLCHGEALVDDRHHAV